MKTGYYTPFLLLYAILVLYSCKESDPQERLKDITGRAQIPDQGLSVENVQDEIVPENKTEDNGCLKNIPQRVIDASVLPGAEFKQVDFMGYEKIELPTGDKLLIINWGCESYNLTFRFETSRFGADTSKIKQWYSILTQLLYVIEPAIDSPVKIQRGINEIHNYLKQDTMPVAYNVPLNLRQDSVFSDMVFERVKILGDTAVRLDVTFSVSSL
jgi:hypothetical protein